MGMSQRGRGATALIVLRLALGFVFLASGTAKILHPYAFLQDVYACELVGADVGLIVAAVLPWLEMTLAACLLLGLSLRGALYASTLLLFSFVIAQASVLVRGLEIGCGCFSSAHERGHGHLVNGGPYILPFLCFSS